MNNFASIFEELSKLYEEDVQEVEQTKDEEEKLEEGVLGTALAVGAGSLVGSAIGNALSENAEEDEVVEDEVVEDEVPAEEVPAEEPVEDEEPRRVICECDKCGALVIKDEVDIAVDEETDLVNVEDECQFCEEANGYKIVGVVAPYKVAEEAIEDEDEDITDVEEEPVEDGEVVEESLETSIEDEEEIIDEDLADWYRKKFDKGASIDTQQAWEDELNGEMGEISDKRRAHLERKFQQQRDWEKRHPDKVEKIPTLTPFTKKDGELEELFDADINFSLDGGEGNDVDVL